ncbi:MAG: hypothetical protein HYX63_19405 [Gammaproteobacteria bacterium]|nr:hypothetical protein [Gammaproteobacteria bacterium]
MNLPLTEPVRHNRVTLLLIIAAFILPIVIAWLYATGRLDLRGRALMNHGELLSPPIDLAALNPSPTLSPLLKLAPSEWAAVVVEPTNCGDACVRALNELLVIRELIGQGGVRVSIHALVAKDSNTESSHGARIHVDSKLVKALASALHARQLAALPAVMLLDWRHQVVMRYAIDAPPRDILKDLQRLLRASEIR